MTKKSNDKNILIRKDANGHWIPTRPLLQKELRYIYDNISRHQFVNLINGYKDEIGEKTGHLYSIRQGAIIISIIGEPSITMLLGDNESTK